MNPIQKYMLRLVFSGAGKTILHKGSICEVVETHNQIRRLQPLVNETLDESNVSPFWVPRRPTDKKQFKVTRMWKSRRHRTLMRPPFGVWSADSAEGLQAVPLPPSNLLTIADAEHLVRELGYDAHAAFASVTRPMVNTKSDRRRIGVVKKNGRWLDRTSFVQPIPYVAAPTRHTTQGFLSRETVLQAVARMRTSDKMRMAVVEVVFRRQSPTAIAKKYRINLETLKKYSTRIRQRISGGPENGENPSEIDVFEVELSTLLT